MDGVPVAHRARDLAWGGVIAQAVLLVVTLGVVAITGRPGSPFAAELVGAFIGPNLSAILFNLLPIPPLDGAEAWKILPILGSRLRKRRGGGGAIPREKATKTQLRSAYRERTSCRPCPTR